MANRYPAGLRTPVNIGSQGVDEITITIKFQCTPEVSEHIGKILSDKNSNDKIGHHYNFELVQVLPSYLRSADFIIEETHGSDTGAGKSIYGCTLQASNIITKK